MAARNVRLLTRVTLILAIGCLMTTACSREQPQPPRQQPPTTARGAPQEKPSAQPPSRRTDPDHQEVTIRGRKFKLELALTPAQQFTGLSDRREIPADGGMLFVFPAPRILGFVMRRCHVPIDVIYLDSQGKVVNWHAMQLDPYAFSGEEFLLTSYPSSRPAQFAIELRGGTVAALGVQSGDAIELPLEELKALAR